jgi:hypothetical protein
MNTNEATLDDVVAGINRLADLTAIALDHAEQSTSLIARNRQPEQARTGSIDGILFAGTITIGPNGRFKLTTPTPYGRVGIITPANVTLANFEHRGDDGGSPPVGSGIVAFLATPMFNEVPFVGETLTVYGAPATNVFICARIGSPQ